MQQKVIVLHSPLRNVQQVAIDKFNNDPETTVFLISLKAGGIALNLTVANYCFLLDPWWNVRFSLFFVILFSLLLNSKLLIEFTGTITLHLSYRRLGQYKCISAIRIIIPNTIEERILQVFKILTSNKCSYKKRNICSLIQPLEWMMMLWLV